MKHIYKYFTHSKSISPPDKFISLLRNLFSVINLEVIFWTFALIYLAFFNNVHSTHFTICPLSNLGIEHCPGCGLGNSISLFFSGDFIESFKAHILGIPAVSILVYRILSLIRINRLIHKKIKLNERTQNA